MYEDILLPTDGSSPTVQALNHALAIADAHDARIHVLYVQDKRRYLAAGEGTKDEIKRAVELEGKRALEDAQMRIEDEGVECVSKLDEGIPDRRIAEYAEDADIDIIVMGTHGKTGPEQIATLGSTTERVVKRAETPVLVVDLS